VLPALLLAESFVVVSSCLGFEPGGLATIGFMSSESDHWESVWLSKRFDEVSWHHADAST